jgi:hypothetical protein
MIKFAQLYFPDWAYWSYLWATNHRRVRERYPNLRAYFRFRRELREAWNS